LRHHNRAVWTRNIITLDNKLPIKLTTALLVQLRLDNSVNNLIFDLIIIGDIPLRPIRTVRPGKGRRTEPYSGRIVQLIVGDQVEPVGDDLEIRLSLEQHDRESHHGRADGPDGLFARGVRPRPSIFVVLEDAQAHGLEDRSWGIRAIGDRSQVPGPPGHVEKELANLGLRGQKPSEVATLSSRNKRVSIMRSVAVFVNDAHTARRLTACDSLGWPGSGEQNGS
jgi:hypothetical protein